MKKILFPYVPSTYGKGFPARRGATRVASPYPEGIKAFLFLLLLASTSCVYSYRGIACIAPTEIKQQRAQAMYNSFGTKFENVSIERGREIFGCNFWDGDYVYSYSTLWGKKYILVHNGEPVTYVDEDEVPKEKFD